MLDGLQEAIWKRFPQLQVYNSSIYVQADRTRSINIQMLIVTLHAIFPFLRMGPNNPTDNMPLPLLRFLKHLLLQYDYTLAFSSSKAAFSFSMSCFLAGHEIPSPSFSFGFGI